MASGGSLHGGAQIGFGPVGASPYVGSTGTVLTSTPVGFGDMGATGGGVGAQAARWAALLEREVSLMLSAQAAHAVEGQPASHSDLMDKLTREFESAVIRTALRHTRGRRIDAALRLGIGRNTITRKIQELHLEDDGP